MKFHSPLSFKVCYFEMNFYLAATAFLAVLFAAPTLAATDLLAVDSLLLAVVDFAATDFLALAVSFFTFAVTALALVTAFALTSDACFLAEIASILALAVISFSFSIRFCFYISSY